MLKVFDLTGKCAIVTGGGRGLGTGITEGLAEAGAKVVIIGSSENVLSVAENYRKNGLDVLGLHGDISIRENIPIIFEKAVSLLGNKLDILVNNAGIQRRNSVENFKLEDWDDVINVNLSAVFQLCQLAGKKMFEQGSGKIVNMASVLSFFGGYGVVAYAASKGGVAQLTKALSNEWAGTVQVNAIAPGYMATDMNSVLTDDDAKRVDILTRVPAARWGKPQDLKGLAVFLSSEASDFISGTIIPIDGGYLVR